MVAKFWVAGTGNWSDTNHWSLATGGTIGAPVPTSVDAVTIDNVGTGTLGLNGGTLTVDQNIVCQSITCGAAVGTINFGSFNVTLSTAPGFSGTGSTARTITGGTGTWNVTVASGAGAAFWNMGNITGLTNPTTAFASLTALNITNSGTSHGTFSGGGCTYGPTNFLGHANKGGLVVSGVNTFASLNVTGPNLLTLTQSITQTVTGALTIAGSSGNAVAFTSNNGSTIATISAASASVAWAIINQITATGAAVPISATNSIDGYHNTGFTFTAPSGGATGVIGG